MAETITSKALLVQGLSTMAIAYLTGLTGFIYAWPSYTVGNFKSNETVLSRPMTSAEISLLGSVTNIGSLVVTPSCGFIVNSLGRKYSAMLFGLPYVLAWVLISVTTSVPMVIAAIGLAGVGAAGQAVTSVYIAEVVQDSIRGAMTSSTVSGFFIGLLFSYTLGGYLTYHQVVYAHLLFSILYILLLSLLKESPVFLLLKEREEEAANSIAFYRQVHVTSKEVEFEIKKIKLQLDPRINKILEGDNDEKAVEGLLEKPEEKIEKKSSWRFLMESKSSKRALATVLIIMSSTIMMGAIVLQVYAEPLFKEAIPSMNANTCAILLAVVFLVASLLCGITVDRFGRRFLLTSTCIGSGIFTLLLGAQLHLHFAPHWATAIFIYGYCFVFNMGASTVPYVLTAEVFLPEVRGLCNSISMAVMWISNFVELIIFNPLVDIFGLGPLFYGFTVICFLAALYSHVYLPETKGLSADAIQLLFLNKESKRSEKHKRNGVEMASAHLST